METIGNILNQRIEKKSDSQYKLQQTCPKCGEHLYKSYNILGKNRILPVSCKCKREKAAERKRISEAKEKQIRLQTLIKNSLMDEKFKNSTFENWDFKKGNDKMYHLGIKYAEQFKKCKKDGLGLLIHGQPGNGKTYLSSCIANSLLRNFVPVICVSINGLLERIQQTYNRFGKEAQSDVIRVLCNADLLIIDDLGTEKKTEWSKSTIYNIIDSRYRSNLPLIITSNLDITNGILNELYGKRTEDRILEMCTPILNTQKSIRIDEAKKKTKILKTILEN